MKILKKTENLKVMKVEKKVIIKIMLRKTYHQAQIVLIINIVEIVKKIEVFVLKKQILLI
jgi:hypothetical protein